MTKQYETPAQQLALDFSAKAPLEREVAQTSWQPAKILAFADRATIEIRRDAVSRVQAAGIFEARLKA